MRSQTRAGRLARIAVVVAALAVAGCSSGDRPSLPTLSTTTTTSEGSTTTTSEGGSTTTERSTTTTTREPTTTTTSADSTTTSSSESSTTSTTEAPTTTTTREPTTTTTERPTTTTAEVTTTTAPATDPTSDDGGSSSSVWLLIGAAALLLVAAAIVAIVAVARSRSNARAQWTATGRDLARRAHATATDLDQAASVIAGPVGASRQVWLDSANALTALAAEAGALVADAPDVPGDPEGTNSLQAALRQLQTSLTVCHSAAVDAERTRFELLNPTTEQLDFASHSVRQACATVIADVHTLGVGLDRVDPPTSRPT